MKSLVTKFSAVAMLASLAACGHHSTPATSCVVTELHPIATAGDHLTARVTFKDASNNVVKSYSGSPMLSSSDASADLPPPAQFQSTDQGSRLEAFRLLTAGNQSVTFSDGAVSCAGYVRVNAGAATIKLVVATDADASQPVTGTVAMVDAYNNPVTNFAGSVTLASTDAAGAPVAPVVFSGSEGGRQSFTATFNTLGTQTLTASAANAATGTAQVRVHGFVYSNPNPTFGKIQLVLNTAASSPGLVQLDLVSNTSQQTQRGGGSPGYLRGGVYAAGMNLPVDTSRAVADTTLLVEGNVLTLGTGGAKAEAAALPTTGPTANVLYTGVSKKAAGAGASNDDDNLSPGQVFYSVRLKLATGAPVGTVFDGNALGANFRAAVRNATGNDVIRQPDFAIGKLVVQ